MAVNGKNVREFASVSISMADKQTYNHKTYHTSMDQTNESSELYSSIKSLWALYEITYTCIVLFPVNISD